MAWVQIRLNSTDREDRGRIHLHGIFFGNQAAEPVIEKWKYGYVFIGNFVTEKTINYISKYMLKDDLREWRIRLAFLS